MTSKAPAKAAPQAGQPAKAKVFISYSRKDMAFVDRLELALKTHGFSAAIDRSEIYAFEEWWKRIETLITQADTVVFVLSPDSVASEVALKEVAFAASLNKRFAPIVCRQVDDRAVPEALAKFNFIFFDDEARFHESADRLAQALATDIAWIRRHTEFGEEARNWSLANRPNGLLLRSPALEEAEHWIATRPDRRDASLYPVQPAGGNAKANRAHGEPYRRPFPRAPPCRPCLLAVPDRAKQFRRRSRDCGQNDHQHRRGTA